MRRHDIPMSITVDNYSPNTLCSMCGAYFFASSPFQCAGMHTPTEASVMDIQVRVITIPSRKQRPLPVRQPVSGRILLLFSYCIYLCSRRESQSKTAKITAYLLQNQTQSGLSPVDPADDPANSVVHGVIRCGCAANCSSSSVWGKARTKSLESLPPGSTADHRSTKPEKGHLHACFCFKRLRRCSQSQSP